MIDNEHVKLFKDGVQRSCVVFDLGGFSLKNMDYQFMKFMIGILQNYYPDSMGQCLILNSPWLFSGCWLILKRWIDPVSQQKIRFVSQQELLEFIEKDQIPTLYGGTSGWEYVYKYPLDVFDSISEPKNEESQLSLTPRGDIVDEPKNSNSEEVQELELPTQNETEQLLAQA